MDKRLIFFLSIGFFYIFYTKANAQMNNWRTHLEQLAEEELSEEIVENMFQELTLLESNPFNLNDVTREQLERFPLLSYEQATAISDFLEKNRPLYTVYELRNITKLDFNTIELILPFFYVGETEKRKPKIDEMFRYGRHDIQMRIDKTLNQRAGYGQFSDSILERYPNRKYRGEDFYHSLKYAFSYRDKIQFGVVGEKDAGEPFFKKDYPKGYDHYGMHLIIRDVGKFKTIAIGDYRLSFGQGLILNNDFMLAKAWASTNIIKRTIEPKRHFSTAEYGFFRGAAAVYQVKNVDITAFYSNKKFDANLSADGNMTSFKIDGYHRTPSEIDKKHNSREEVSGANINYRKGDFQLGASIIYHKYNRMLYPTIQEYNIYYLRDSSNLNASIDYSYRFNKITIGGETAIAKNGAVATINMLQYSPSYSFAVSVLHRHLPITYNALHARVFSESSRVQNENGFYIGSSLNPLPKLYLTLYADWFSFPWVKSSVNQPSDGIDLYFLGKYNLNRNSDLELRYKYKQKEQNAAYPNQNTRTVLPYNTQKIRLRYNKLLESGWNFRTSADFAIYSQKHFDTESGYMISQNVSYRGNSKITGDIFGGYFKADSYAARIYSYERNILSTFYMPSFYGEGIRLALSGRYNFTANFSFSIKVGHSRYFDRQTIGSGTELIDGNNRTDIYTFLRYRF